MDGPWRASRSADHYTPRALPYAILPMLLSRSHDDTAGAARSSHFYADLLHFNFFRLCVVFIVVLGSRLGAVLYRDRNNDQHQHDDEHRKPDSNDSSNTDFSNKREGLKWLGGGGGGWDGGGLRGFKCCC